MLRGTVQQDDAFLLGLLGTQLGLLSPQQLETAGAAWLTRRPTGVPLAKVLIETGALTGQQVQFLEEAQRQVVAAHGSPQAALRALGSTYLPQVQKSLGGLEATLPSGEHPMPTDSLDGVELVSQEVPGRYEEARGLTGEVEVLGTGGLGVVTTVTDHFVGRQVAMKQLHARHVQAAEKDTHTSTTLESRFLREARVTGQLEHPAIVPVFEIGRRTDASLYYTMRRIRGRTLSEAIAQAKTLTERLTLLPSVLTVCQAIAYAHSRNVIHRDLKPANVMLGDFGETYLLDWGLARVKGKRDLRQDEPKLAPDITGSRYAGVVGTPAYMSPEQARGDAQDIDERSDVWGLGGLVFEVLTGRAPFVGKSPWEVIAAIASDPLTPVRDLAPEVPADLVALCDKALRKRPADRYQTARALAKDLEAWLNGARVSAHTYSSREVLGRFVRRSRAVLAVAAAALVALLALGVSSYVRIREERNEARDFARLVIGDVGQTLRSEAQSLPILDAVTRRADTFYRRLGRLEDLPADERDELGFAWDRLAEINTRAGRRADAEACYRRCLETVAARGAGPPTALSVTNELNCSSALVRITELDARSGERAALEARAQALLTTHQDDWPEDRRWQESVSFYSRRLAIAALEQGDAASSERYLLKAIQVDKQLHARHPNNDTLRRLVSASAQLELSRWSMDRRDEALAVGKEAVALTEADADAANVHTLSAMASLLRQHGMLLGWASRAEEGAVASARAEVFLQRAVALDPNDVVVRGEYGDLLLELGRPEEAWTQYQHVGDEMKGDYLASAVLVALTSGRQAEVLAHRADIEAGGDSQALWVLATVLAARGEVEAAAALLHQASENNTSLQLPRASLRLVGPTLPAPLRAAYEDFLARMVAAMDDPDNEAVPRVYLRYAEALQKLKAPPRR